MPWRDRLSEMWRLLGEMFGRRPRCGSCGGRAGVGECLVTPPEGPDVCFGCYAVQREIERQREPVVRACRLCARPIAQFEDEATEFSVEGWCSRCAANAYRLPMPGEMIFSNVNVSQKMRALGVGGGVSFPSMDAALAWRNGAATLQELTEMREMPGYLTCGRCGAIGPLGGCGCPTTAQRSVLDPAPRLIDLDS